MTQDEKKYLHITLRDGTGQTTFQGEVEQWSIGAFCLEATFCDGRRVLAYNDKVFCVQELPVGHPGIYHPVRTGMSLVESK